MKLDPWHIAGLIYIINIEWAGYTISIYFYVIPHFFGHMNQFKPTPAHTHRIPRPSVFEMFPIGKEHPC